MQRSDGMAPKHRVGGGIGGGVVGGNHHPGVSGLGTYGPPGRGVEGAGKGSTDKGPRGGPRPSVSHYGPV